MCGSERSLLDRESQLQKICLNVHKAFMSNNYSHDQHSQRCVATSTVLKTELEKNGFDACFFPTTAIYTSKPIILAIANEMPVTLGTGEYLMVYSDDTRPEVIPLGNNDVGGHVCLLTKINQNVYFIDPTAFSFQRIVGEIHNIMVPDVIVEKVQLSTIDFEVLRSYGVRNQPYELPRIAFEFTFNKNTANLTKASFIYGRLHNPFAGDFNVANHSDVLERLAEKD